MLSFLLLSFGNPSASFAFGTESIRGRCHKTAGNSLFGAATNEGDDENSALLEKARKLREEASLLEDNLRSTASPSLSPKFEAAQLAVRNTVLEGSIWTLSYRFSSEPTPKRENKNSNKAIADPPRVFYSGKVTILLKQDGYSELLEVENRKDATENDIRVTKVWGWDKETSNEDDLDYLLFSMDVRFPASDPSSPDTTDRCYWQARIETDSTGDGSISLKEGTITIKKDVTESTGGMWGLFNVAGILTEFRYCGDFVAKPDARR